MEKIEYIAPETEIVEFDMVDVITMSREEDETEEQNP